MSTALARKEGTNDRVPLEVDANGSLRVTSTGAVASTVDVSDRAARLVGHVTVDNPTANPETGLAKTADVDRLIAEVDGLEEAIGTTLDAATADTVVGRLKALVAKDFATNATLLQVRDYLDTVETLLAARATETTLAAIEALQTTIRDTLYRRTDPLPAGTNLIGYTAPSTVRDALLGNFSLSSTGRTTLTVAGNFRILFTNPTGSGRTARIHRLAGMATAAGWAALFLNPTAGLPTTAPRPVTNAVLGGGTPAVLTLRSDISATAPLGGGTDTGLVVGIPPNARHAYDLPPLFLAPGQSLGINVPFAGSADAVMSAYWTEA